MKTQDAEQALATHVAQDYTQRECGDRRAKNHQHVYFILHNGPQSRIMARRRRVVYALCMWPVADKRQFPSYDQDVIVTDSSLTLTLVSIAE
jgi:hypothetical protein